MFQSNTFRNVKTDHVETDKAKRRAESGVGKEVDAHIRARLIVTRESLVSRGSYREREHRLPLSRSSAPFAAMPLRASRNSHFLERLASILVARRSPPTLSLSLSLHPRLDNESDEGRQRQGERHTHDASQIPYRGPFLDDDSTSYSPLSRSSFLTKRQRARAPGRLVLPNRRRRIARGYCFSRIHKVAEIQSLGEVHCVNHEVIECRSYYTRTIFSNKIYIKKLQKIEWFIFV